MCFNMEKFIKTHFDSELRAKDERPEAYSTY